MLSQQRFQLNRRRRYLGSESNCPLNGLQLEERAAEQNDTGASPIAMLSVGENIKLREPSESQPAT
jgi:hypothetical protein